MGTIFKIVVINCTIPEVKMPKELIQVKNQIVVRPVKIARSELVANAGMKVLKALIKETVIAALVHHVETKYPQATRKPAKSPSPF